jgi:hypothetical protein
MSRLYYDNAIDALYMAEKFGVKIEGNYTSYGRQYKLRGVKKQITSYHLAGMFRLTDGKLYIALESIDIFEPKEGDVIAWKGDYAEVYRVRDEHSETWHIVKSDVSGYLKYQDCKIIQRNNVPFIMPKSEVSDDR